MTRLSEREYWDSVHESERAQWEAPRGQGGGAALGAPPWKSAIKSALGGRVLALASGYEEFLLWEVLYPRFMPKVRGAKVLEVGSAPGEHLVALKRRFGLDPYGVEYSETGARLNREVFAAAGVDPSQVIEADFFSAEFQREHAGRFDVVVSRGFIEHFDDVGDVIEKHLNLLKDGGTLFVNIPVLRGVNRGLTWLFHKEVLPIHNLSIMERGAFARLFEGKSLEKLFCDYYGRFSFYLFNTRPDSAMRRLLRLCFHVQLPLNALLRLLFKDRPGGNRWTSPNLLFVGVKRAGDGVGSVVESKEAHGR